MDSQLELKSLVGFHKLSAVDMIDASKVFGKKFEASNGIAFTLDGVTYLAVEDPDDGYRSYLGFLVVLEEELVNQFPPIDVLCSMKEGDNDVLQMRCGNSNIVLEVGTEDVGHYYPSFIGAWLPEML